MGKSTAARMLRYQGVPVHDADLSVHKLLGPNGAAVKEVAAVFREALSEDHINRKTLGGLVFGNPEKLKQLEAILHPKVHRLTQKFLRSQQRMGRKIVALDIPLLFETKGENRVDKVMVASAPLTIQRQRVLARSGMTAERFETIRAKQTPDAEKRRRADYIIPTGLGKPFSFKAIQESLRDMQAKAPRGSAFPNQSYKTRHRNFSRVF